MLTPEQEARETIDALARQAPNEGFEPLLPDESSLADGHDSLIDGTLCALSVVVSMRGEAIKPSDRARATKEGWIWVWKPVVQGDQP